MRHRLPTAWPGKPGGRACPAGQARPAAGGAAAEEVFRAGRRKEQTSVTSIGTSGWSYDHWAPELYPPGLPPGQRLARYAASFGTVELNATFYRWPRHPTFASRRRGLAAGVRLAVNV